MAKQKPIPKMYSDNIGKTVQVILRERKHYTDKLFDDIDKAEGVIERVEWTTKLEYLVRFNEKQAYHIPTTDCRILGD